MCCCGKPTINGDLGAYSWDGKTRITYQPQPPAIADGDTLLWDEPGRCGGLDCHSHHFRLVKKGGNYAVLVRHGAGDERVVLGGVARQVIPALAVLDTNARFWLLHTLYSAHRDAADNAAQARDAFWRSAAAQKRIKTRKLRGRGAVKVWIEPEKPRVAVAA